MHVGLRVVIPEKRSTGNLETTPAGAPAVAANKMQRPDATCEGKKTVQGPVKKQQPDGMSHRGGGMHLPDLTKKKPPTTNASNLSVSISTVVREGFDRVVHSKLHAN